MFCTKFGLSDFDQSVRLFFSLRSYSCQTCKLRRVCRLIFANLSRPVLHSIVFKLFSDIVLLLVFVVFTVLACPTIIGAHACNHITFFFKVNLLDVVSDSEKRKAANNVEHQGTILILINDDIQEIVSIFRIHYQ